MRKLIVYMLISLPGLDLMAQQTNLSDSIYLYEQPSRQLEWAHSSATHLLFRHFNNIARSQLYAAREQGSFRGAQQAYEQTAAGFHTDGVKKLGRFHLAGQFDLEKRWEDSAAWWNAGEYDEAQPYYFFAGKSGKYEKQLYNLSATAAYDLYKEKLYVGMSGNYRYHSTTRSVDPRPDVKEFSTILRPEITGRFGKHLAGAGLVWGRGSENTEIGYTNKNFIGNQLYLERNSFMSLGFGHIGKFDKNLQRYHETNGFFAQYATHINKWQLQASAAYELWQEDISLDTTSTRNRHELYAFLQQEQSFGKLLLEHTGNKGNQQLELTITTKSLLNWASEFNSTSYQYTATEAAITYRQLWRKQNGISVELGAGCVYKEQYKEDIVAAHKYQRQLVTPHVYAGIYRQAAGKSWLSLRVTPGYRHTLTNDLSVPATQENYFTRGVAYTDYLYWQKNCWSIATVFSYIQKEKPKRHRLGATLQVKWQQASDGVQTELPALYLSSGSRWCAGASLNLYL